MKVLELTGVVDANETVYDGPYAENTEGPLIGGTHVIKAFNDTFAPTGSRHAEGKDFTVLLAHGGDERIYKGYAWMMEGDGGYSTWTPGNAPDMWVGKLDASDTQSTDFLEVLTALHGQTVHLRIDDGPAPE